MTGRSENPTYLVNLIISLEDQFITELKLVTLRVNRAIEQSKRAWDLARKVFGQTFLLHFKSSVPQQHETHQVIKIMCVRFYMSSIALRYYQPGSTCFLLYKVLPFGYVVHVREHFHV